MLLVSFYLLLILNFLLFFFLILLSEPLFFFFLFLFPQELCLYLFIFLFCVIINPEVLGLFQIHKFNLMLLNHWHRNIENLCIQNRAVLFSFSQKLLIFEAVVVIIKLLIESLIQIQLYFRLYFRIQI